MKISIIVRSDPQRGGEEALGSHYNALAVAYESRVRQAARDKLCDARR
ncbi:MAG TPA: hypothetical protein VIT21_12135 [Chthoniobacterales bacterium]